MFATPQFRVLVVDDVEAWRRFAYSSLQEQRGFVIVGEASDGLEAVEKAQQLQPDLILLDIGLPSLNGIEVARRVRTKVPNSKILFFSENRSRDVAEEALGTGASAYVLKSDGAQLLRALEALIQGRQYLSSSMADPSEGRTPDSNQLKQSVPFPPNNIRIRHEVEFYKDDPGFVSGFSRTIAAILKAANSVILIATEPHRAGILKSLRANGVNVDFAIKQGNYIAADAEQTLREMMCNGMPEPIRCATAVQDAIRRAEENRKVNASRIVFCGECAPLLLAKGQVDAAIKLEHLWDEITRNHGVDTLCGYTSNRLVHGESGAVFQRICAEHTAVHGHELGY